VGKGPNLNLLLNLTSTLKKEEGGGKAPLGTIINRTLGFASLLSSERKKGPNRIEQKTWPRGVSSK